MLNSKDLAAALMVKSRQWRDPGKFKEPHYIPESLAAKLQATLNMIPACTRYAAPSTALTLMNEKELGRFVGRWVIALSSDELVSNSPGLCPSHDETFW
jgi:hypothetical protein